MIDWARWRKAVASGVMYPEMRIEILSCLEDLADTELQRRAWIGGEFIVGRYLRAQDPINNLEWIVGDDPPAAIGFALRDQLEAVRVVEAIRAINVACSQMDEAAAAWDSELLATPGWPSVVEAARLALGAMQVERSG